MWQRKDLNLFVLMMVLFFFHGTTVAPTWLQKTYGETPDASESSFILLQPTDGGSLRHLTKDSQVAERSASVELIALVIQNLIENLIS